MTEIGEVNVSSLSGGPKSCCDRVGRVYILWPYLEQQNRVAG
jgi:hypothetical protein